MKLLLCTLLAIAAIPVIGILISWDCLTDNEPDWFQEPELEGD